MTRRSVTQAVLTVALATFAAAAGAATAPAHPWCGTTPFGFQERLAVHQDHLRRLERERPGVAAAASRALPQAAQVGNVAVVPDNGSIIIQENELDLDGHGVQYLPQKKNAYVAAPFGDGLSDDVGSELELGDDAARQVAFPKGFGFPFYGGVYKAMFVHSDGNVTFDKADASSSARNLSRLLGGPPRVAALFSDLNPETAAGEGAGVFVLASKSRVLVTWRDIPTFGRNDSNTVQLALYANGRITVVYGELAVTDAVVGISPGNGARAQLVDLANGLPTGPLKVAIAERFQRTREVDDLAIAQAFYREFADEYDHLIVWFDFQQNLGAGAFAYEFTVKNEIKGIGVGLYDGAAAAGSKGRLRSFVQMGMLSRYPDDPYQSFLGTNNTLDILGQETGHRWGAFVQFIDGNGERSDALLGRDGSHWSFCHDTLASDLEGNAIADEGGRFRTVAATERFSPLDQYLMGLASPAQVPPFFYVEGCGHDPAKGPSIGDVMLGTRVDVGIDQVIAAEGPRVPASNKAQRDFGMAFVIVSEGGSFPSAETIAKVDAIRSSWEEYFAQAVDFRGSVSTTLKRRQGRR